MSETPSRMAVSRRALLDILGLTFLAVAHFLIACNVIQQKTPTVDEVAHLPAGISYLQTGTFKAYRLSPPLARLIPALAAEFLRPRMYYAGTWRRHNPMTHWLFAAEFLIVNSEKPADRERYLTAFTWARTVVAAVSALTIPILYCWGSWWCGRPAGWLAAALWALSPNIIAHASMMTTDLAATSVTLIASFYFARWLERPTSARAAWAGVCLGLAQLTKFSCLLLLVLWPVWGLAFFLHKGCRSEANARGALGLLLPWQLARIRVVRQSLAIGLSAWLVLLAGYGFEGTFKPIGTFPFVCDMLTRPRTATDGPARNDFGSSNTYNRVLKYRVNRFRGTWLEAVPCPLPEHYIAGYDEQKLEADGGSVATGHRGYQMYLRGTLDRNGWWWYYYYALAIKIPLSTWLLVILALVGVVCWQRACVWALAPWIMFVAAPVLAMSLLVDIDLGVRYVLPAFPFLFLIAGSAIGASRPRWMNAFAVAAIAWNAVALARIHPHELSYFNELVGGPANGRYHLMDSNLDWGQDLRGLGKWLRRHLDWKEAKIAYWGSVPPEFEDIPGYQIAPRDLNNVPGDMQLPNEDPDVPTTFGPQPGKFAVSVNFERGMEFHTPCPLALATKVKQARPRAMMPGTPFIIVPAGAYAYFQHFTPHIEPEIGYSILLYDISLDEANRVRSILEMPLLEGSAGSNSMAVNR